MGTGTLCHSRSFWAGTKQQAWGGPGGSSQNAATRPEALRALHRLLCEHLHPNEVSNHNAVVVCRAAVPRLRLPIGCERRSCGRTEAHNLAMLKEGLQVPTISCTAPSDTPATVPRHQIGCWRNRSSPAAGLHQPARRPSDGIMQYRVANSLVLPPLLQVNNLSSPISVVASRPAVAHRLLLPAPAPAALPDHTPRIHVRERFPRPIHVRSCGSPSPCLAAHLYTKPLNVLHPLLLQRGSAVEACRRVQLSCLQPAAAAGAGAGAGGPGGARACC